MLRFVVKKGVEFQRFLIVKVHTPFILNLTISRLVGGYIKKTQKSTHKLKVGKYYKKRGSLL